VPHYRRVGDVPRKRHTVHAAPNGDGRYLEELMGSEGFRGPSSLLYHRHSPSALLRIDEGPIERTCLVPNRPLRPHHLRTGALDNDTADDPVLGRVVVLGNDAVTISSVRAHESSPLYRNATGDELVYVHAGEARLESVFGALDVAPGDYVVIPAGTTHRWVLDGELTLLVLSARGHVGVPERHLNGAGQLLEGAPFSERDQRAPTETLAVDGEAVPVLVRTRDGLSVHVHATHPFDVVGWDGCLYPWAFSIHDFEPITGRVHQPPPVHQTFEGPNFVICSFVPRKVDYHPLAIPVPYNHHNVDSDEMLFYTGGNYEARKGSGIEQGSISLHPGGFTHGPQPGAVERSIGIEAFDELAVMVDTFRPLDLCDAGLECEDPGYAWTWARTAPATGVDTATG